MRRFDPVAAASAIALASQALAELTDDEKRRRIGALAFVAWALLAGLSILLMGVGILALARRLGRRVRRMPVDRRRRRSYPNWWPGERPSLETDDDREPPDG